MDWDPTMQVVSWVGRQSKMKNPNSEITETGRRKGQNKKMKGLGKKWIKMQKKVKKIIKFNHEMVSNSMIQGLNHQKFGF